MNFLGMHHYQYSYVKIQVYLKANDTVGREVDQKWLWKSEITVL